MLSLVALVVGYHAFGAALATLGRLMYASMEWFSAMERAKIALRLLGLALVVGGGAYALRHGPAPRWARALVLALLLGRTAVAYQRSLRFQDSGSLGPLRTTSPARSALRDVSSHRPQRSYQLNNHGLRGPDFTPRPAPGTLRVAVVGDSYVFGLGVGDDETLPMRLQARLPPPRHAARLEVLNLGIPGNNLESHVLACQHAWDALGAALVVLVYHLPNDFARWDLQDERRDAGRWSLFSALSFIQGREVANALVTRLIVDGGGLAPFPAPAAQLEVLDAVLPALDRAQRDRPLIVLPVEFIHLPGAVERFARRPATVVTRRFGFDADLLIPVDGHPNAAGFRAYAEAVREAGPRLSQWRDLFREDATGAEGPPPGSPRGGPR